MTTSGGRATDERCLGLSEGRHSRPGNRDPRRRAGAGGRLPLRQRRFARCDRLAGSAWPGTAA